MNTYRHIFSVEPESRGEAVALLERDDLENETDLFDSKQFSAESPLHCSGEEVLVIKGKITISF